MKEGGGGEEVVYNWNYLLIYRHFLMADDTAGILIVSYEVWCVTRACVWHVLVNNIVIFLQGRVVSTIKSAFPSSSLNSQTISISPDTVAIRDKKDEKG